MSTWLSKSRSMPSEVGARAHVAHGRLRRLLHHVAQLAGEDQLALAGTIVTSVGSSSPPCIGVRQARSPGRSRPSPPAVRSGSGAGRGSAVRLLA